jgi:nitrite reductase/ring-hydroxylating ferredoxin subunit
LKKAAGGKKRAAGKSPVRGWTKIGRPEDLAGGRTLKFAFERDGMKKEGFAFRRGDTVRAFLNECRHWTVGLDLDDNRFFTPDGRFIVCMNHGALYDPLDGRCLEGPCAGAFLEPIPVVLRGRTLYAETGPAPPPA